MSSGYYCRNWTQHLGDEVSGQTIGEIWTELRCNQWVGGETVYMDWEGNVDDRGDMNNEQCLDHHGGYWAENVYHEALNTLIEHGWYTCQTCTDALARGEEDNTQVWYDEEMFLDSEHVHIEGANPLPQPTRETLAEAIMQAPTTPPPFRPLENWTPPIPPGTYTVELPPRPTWPSPLILNDPWHMEPPIPAEVEEQIRIYLRGSHRTNYTEHPSNTFTGVRLAPGGNVRQFVMLRTETDMLLVPNNGWTRHRFMPGPARTARSTASMWETPA